MTGEVIPAFHHAVEFSLHAVDLDFGVIRAVVGHELEQRIRTPLAILAQARHVPMADRDRLRGLSKNLVGA